MSDWKDTALAIAKAGAPLLGTALGGPAGAAVAAMIAGALGTDTEPAAIQQALVTSPDAAVKLRQIEADQRVELQRLVVTAEANRLAAETAATQAVNASIQAEAASDHWPTYSWRPAIGFAVAFNTMASSVIVLAVFIPLMLGSKAAGEAVGQLPAVLGALSGISVAVLPILGIASWFRGKMQADPAVPADTRG